MNPSDEALVLRTAAVIIRARSRKPKSLLLKVFCRILEDQADKVDREQRERAERLARAVIAELRAEGHGRTPRGRASLT